MSAPVRPPRPLRASGGGRLLLLLGVVLALAAGGIVIFTISQYTGGPTQMVTVVVAAQTLQPGTKITPDGSNGSTAISQAFTTKSVNASFAPSDAYIYTSQDALNTVLNNQTVEQTFYAGDILRTSDPRLLGVGGAPGSLNNVDPTHVKQGDVIVGVDVKTSGIGMMVPGDTVDVIATECNLPGSQDPGHCETQTTLTNIYVYAVRTSTVFLVLTHQQALELQYLNQSGNIGFVLRKSGDGTSTTTTPVDPTYIVQHFHF
ncbi:MAG: hypothetical protein ABI068_09410 [Ktedonobacterales bacterium]